MLAFIIAHNCNAHLNAFDCLKPLELRKKKLFKDEGQHKTSAARVQELLAVLSRELDSPEASKTLIESFTAFQNPDGDIQLQLESWLKACVGKFEVEQPNWLTVLRCVNQGIIFPAVFHMKKMFTDKFAYKDQKGSWKVRISILSRDLVDIQHRKGEKSQLTGPQENFTFSWSANYRVDLSVPDIYVSVSIIDYIFDKDMDKAIRAELLAAMQPFLSGSAPYLAIWRKPLRKLPVSRDFGRLCAKLSIYNHLGRAIHTRTSQDSGSSLIRKVLLTLAECFNPELVPGLEDSLNLRFKEEGEVMEQLTKVLHEDKVVPDDSHLAAVLKCVNTTIVFPAVDFLHTRIYDKLRYKDVRGTWFTHITLGPALRATASSASLLNSSSLSAFSSSSNAHQNASNNAAGSTSSNSTIPISTNNSGNTSINSNNPPTNLNLMSINMANSLAHASLSGSGTATPTTPTTPTTPVVASTSSIGIVSNNSSVSANVNDSNSGNMSGGGRNISSAGATGEFSFGTGSPASESGHQDFIDQVAAGEVPRYRYVSIIHRKMEQAYSPDPKEQFQFEWTVEFVLNREMTIKEVHMGVVDFSFGLQTSDETKAHVLSCLKPFLRPSSFQTQAAAVPAHEVIDIAIRKLEEAEVAMKSLISAYHPNMPHSVDLRTMLTALKAAVPNTDVRLQSGEAAKAASEGYSKAAEARHSSGSLYGSQDRGSTGSTFLTSSTPGSPSISIASKGALRHSTSSAAILHNSTSVSPSSPAGSDRFTPPSHGIESSPLSLSPDLDRKSIGKSTSPARFRDKSPRSSTSSVTSNNSSNNKHASERSVQRGRVSSRGEGNGSVSSSKNSPRADSAGSNVSPRTQSGTSPKSPRFGKRSQIHSNSNATSQLGSSSDGKNFGTSSEGKPILAQSVGHDHRNNNATHEESIMMTRSVSPPSHAHSRIVPKTRSAGAAGLPPPLTALPPLPIEHAQAHLLQGGASSDMSSPRPLSGRSDSLDVPFPMDAHIRMTPSPPPPAFDGPSSVPKLPPLPEVPGPSPRAPKSARDSARALASASLPAELPPPPIAAKPAIVSMYDTSSDED